MPYHTAREDEWLTVEAHSAFTVRASIVNICKRANRTPRPAKLAGVYVAKEETVAPERQTFPPELPAD